MLVFQSGAQKQLEQQQITTKVFTGADAQRLLKAVGPACEEMLSMVHK